MPCRFLSACFRVFLVYSNLLFSSRLCFTRGGGPFAWVTSLKFSSSLFSSTGEISLKFFSSLYGATGVTSLKFCASYFMERLGRPRSNFVLVFYGATGVTSLKFCSIVYVATGVTSLKCCSSFFFFFFFFFYGATLVTSLNFVLVFMERLG